MLLLFFEEELMLPEGDVYNKIYSKEMVADLKDKKIGVILGNNGFETMYNSIKKAIEEDYYAIITNQVYLLDLPCFIDKDKTRNVFMASIKKNKPLEYVESYLDRKILPTHDLERIYRDLHR